MAAATADADGDEMQESVCCDVKSDTESCFRETDESFLEPFVNAVQQAEERLETTTNNLELYCINNDPEEAGERPYKYTFNDAQNFRDDAEETEARERASRNAGKMFYGYEEGVNIELGDHCFYKVIGDGKGGCKLRQEPSYTSSACDYDAPLDQVVRIGCVHQLPNGGKLRAFIADENANGWASCKMLQCMSGNCGHCFECDESLLPHQNAQIDARVERLSSRCDSLLMSLTREMETSGEESMEVMDRVKVLIEEERGKLSSASTLYYDLKAEKERIEIETRAKAAQMEAENALLTADKAELEDKLARMKQKLEAAQGEAVPNPNIPSYWL